MLKLREFFIGKFTCDFVFALAIISYFFALTRIASNDIVVNLNGHGVAMMASN